MPLTIAAAETILADRCAPWIRDNLGLVIEAVGEGCSRLRLPPGEHLLTSAGVMSAQAVTTLADMTMIVAVASAFGECRAMTPVNHTISFMRATGAVDVIAEGRLLKRGRNLVFGEVTIYAADSDQPIAHATSVHALLGSAR